MTVDPARIHWVDNSLTKGQRRRLLLSLHDKGIQNKAVLEAMNQVPRHFFMPADFLTHAYVDKAMPIAANQTISQPYTVARQTELILPTPGMKVLEVGTGSGYQCAVLCQLGVQVTSIEYVAVLHQQAMQVLQYLGYQPYLLHGDGSQGYVANAPYEAILVTAGAPVVPQALLAQLKVGGRLVIPVGQGSEQRMLRYTRLANGKFQQEDFGAYSFVPLKGNY